MSGGQVNSSKTVFYVNRVAHPSFVDIVSAEPDIELHRLTHDGPESDGEPVIAAAHAYQIDSTRGNIPEKLWATDALLSRSPNLLLVSTTGAGYDTVDVDACTAADLGLVEEDVLYVFR